MMGSGPFLTPDPLDPAGLLRRVQAPERGGTALFIGTVRHGPDDGPVEYIDYSGYEEMVVAELEKIVGETESRWSGAEVAVQHRLGRVPLGEASVVVAAAAPHRSEAFEACRYLIEELKKRVPIWKREFTTTGDSRWRANEPEGHAPRSAADEKTL